MAPYLRILLAEASAETVVRLLHSECMAEAGGKDEEAVAEDDEGDELCDCEFSLAYGGKILLFNARMRLIRGRRYGLCGANGVGKVGVSLLAGTSFVGRDIVCDRAPTCGKVVLHLVAY